MPDATPADTDTDAVPDPQQFAAELIRQLSADLDGVLADGGAVADDAFALLAREARAGAPRGASLVLLGRAALQAYRELVDTDDSPAQPVDDSAGLGPLLDALVPGVRAQQAALQGHAERLVRILALAEPGRPPLPERLPSTITRFYAGLRDRDEDRSGRALIELRALLVHLDANAGALASAAFAPCRVLRPDRFHDWFMRYASLAQSPEAQAGTLADEQAVATLSRDGRISAVVTEAPHPLDAAAQAVRALIPGDDTDRDHALARIRALLDVIDRHRQQPGSALGDVRRDETLYLSLVVAAATAPLDVTGGFSDAALVQVARYNQRLLRGDGLVAPASATRH